jgi:hypothetical protein
MAVSNVSGRANYIEIEACCRSENNTEPRKDRPYDTHAISGRVTLEEAETREDRTVGCTNYSQQE